MPTFVDKVTLAKNFQTKENSQAMSNPPVVRVKSRFMFFGWLGKKEQL
jgi:hypothetical protein